MHLVLEEEGESSISRSGHSDIENNNRKPESQYLKLKEIDEELGLDPNYMEQSQNTGAFSK
jgi:hypothetical protein